MNYIELIRMVTYHLGLAIATIGMILLIFATSSYPSLLSDHVYEISIIVYLALYPHFVTLVILNDMIFLEIGSKKEVK